MPNHSSPGSLPEALIYTGPIVEQKKSGYTRIARRGVTEYVHDTYSHFAFSPTLYGGDKSAAVEMAEQFEAVMKPFGAAKTGRFNDRLTIRVPHAEPAVLA